MQLTKTEALAQGYERCGFDGEGWQCLIDISDFSFNLERNKNKIVLLAEKEGIHPSIGEDELLDLIKDHIIEQWSSETSDDDAEDIAGLLTRLLVGKVCEQANQLLTGKSCYKLTDIELIDDKE